MKRVTVKKNGKYFQRWKLEGNDILGIVFLTLVLGYLVFQLLR